MSDVDESTLPLADEFDDFGEEPPQRKPASRARSTIEWIAVVGGALIVAVVIRTFRCLPSRGAVTAGHPWRVTDGRRQERPRRLRIGSPPRGRPWRDAARPGAGSAYKGGR